MNPSDHIRTLTLRGSNGDNLVALDVVADLSDQITEARYDEDCWVIVLNSRGTEFCLGTHPGAIRESASTTSLVIAAQIAAIEQPVVCTIEGSAHDQGLEIALACDVRVASEAATFRMGHVLAGLMPWDGGTQRLPRLIGRARATEMLLTGKEVSAEDALRFGLVNEVVDGGEVNARARGIAENIARHGPIALRYLKEAVLTGMDGTLRQGLRLEADLSFLLQSTADRQEGIESFIDRRGPTYRNE